MSEFLPPDSAYAQPAWSPTGEDPLVTPPGMGVDGWSRRIRSVFQRSWKSIGLIFAITILLPTVLMGIAAVVITAAMLGPLQREMERAAQTGDSPRFDFDLGTGLTGTAIAIGVVVLFGLILLQLAGYGAATYAATREAAGLPVTLGESMTYGLRRCPGLLGWNFVTGLLIVLGALACILPAFYVVAATALVGPIYLFERARPIGRSFEIFHRNLGRILGRLALIVVLYWGGSIVVGLVKGIANAVLGTTDPSVALPGSIAVSVFGSILSLPLAMFLFVGILVTYAEQRGSEAPATAGSLAAELQPAAAPIPALQPPA